MNIDEILKDLEHSQYWDSARLDSSFFVLQLRQQHSVEDCELIRDSIIEALKYARYMKSRESKGIDGRC